MSEFKHVKFDFDNNSKSYYQNVNGYYFAIYNSGNNQKVLSISVLKDGLFPDISLIKKDFKSIKSINNIISQGFRLMFYIRKGFTNKKSEEYIQDALNHVLDYLKTNGYVNCCETCGRTDEIGLFGVSGTARVLCQEDYNKATDSLVYNKRIEDNKKENVFTGIIGAFLGSLIGVIAIIIVAKLGFVAVVSGIIMGVCVVKGYELLGNKISKVGIVVSILIVIIMTYFATYLSWAFVIAKELELPLGDAIGNCFYIIDYFDLKTDFYKDLFLQWLFTLCGAVPLIINSLSAKQIKNESYVISAINKNIENVQENNYVD